MNSKMPPSIHNRNRAALAFITLAVLLALLLSGSASVSAQEVSDTIKVNTRVVFMDALVKDRRTGVPISDLKPENFEVFDDGTPRTILIPLSIKRTSKISWRMNFITSATGHPARQNKPQTKTQGCRRT